MRILFIILLFLSQFAKAEIFYVSTTGTGGGSGSFASPWDLNTAFNHPAAVDPGDTIYVLAGTYTDTLTSHLTGTLANPIIVKAVGRVIIDGTLIAAATKNIAVLTIAGAYTWYIGFEITNSDPERYIPEEGSNPNERKGNGMDVYGVGTKVINFIVYDCGQGVGTWTPATNSELYGNVIFNNGWLSSDDDHGHGIYAQNETGTKSIKDNIVCNNFSLGVHAYTQAGSLNNFYLEGNAHFNDGFLMGGYVPAEDIELNTNFFYSTGIAFGLLTTGNDTLTLTDNYVPAVVSIQDWSNVTATGNTIFNFNSSQYLIFIGNTDMTFAAGLSTWDWSGNTYYDYDASTHFHHYYNDNVTDDQVNLAEWQAQGQDLDANVQLLPPPNKTVTRINAYDANRAHVIAYNWADLDTVSVSVVGILSAGSTYELRNVQDYFGDVITGTFAGGDSLRVPMINHTVAEPLGLDTLMGENTFPTFGAFVLIKTAADVLPYVTPVPDRGQANAVKISRNTGSGLPHVTLATGTGGEEDFTRDNLIINEGFEGGDPWPSGVFNLGQDNLGEDHGGGTNTWARVQVNTGANEGTSVHQTEVRSGCDGCQSQGYRSEMTFDTDVAANNTEYWYGYSQKFKTPNSGGFWTGNNSGVFIQWHPTGGSGSSTVAMSNDYNENGEGFTLWTNPGGLGDVTHSESGVDIVADTWYHFVWNIFWGTAGNGYVKVWINGVLEFNVTGLDFNTEGQYMKLGMNRWSWSGPDCDASGCTTSSYPTDTWIIQYDNFRVGTSLATFNDVAPVQVLPEPRPIPVVDSLPKGVLTPIDTSKRIQVYYIGVPTVTTPKLTIIRERSYSKCCGTPFGMFCFCSPTPDPRDSVLSVDTIKFSIWGEPNPPKPNNRIKLYDPTKK